MRGVSIVGRKLGGTTSSSTSAQRQWAMAPLQWALVPVTAKALMIQYLGKHVVHLDRAIIDNASREELLDVYKNLCLRDLHFPMRLTDSHKDPRTYICAGLQWALDKGIHVEDFVLVEPGADEVVHDIGSYQTWFLKELIRRDFIAMAELFISLCPSYDFNEQSVDASGMTPCHVAAEKGEDSILSLLVSKSTVDLNLRNSNGDAPLHLAAANGHFEAVKTLCADSQRIDIDAKTTSGGETALHRSVSIETDSSESTNDLLVDVGADINALNNGDMSVLDVARIYGRSTSISWLENRQASSGAEERRRRSTSL